MNKRKTGTFYEEIACKYLQKQGIKILERNFNCHFGEIDIIGKEGDCVIFFEVKFRKDNSFGTPQEAVTKKKQCTISKCSDYYLMRHTEITRIRYDVIAISNTKVTWIKNAFFHQGYSFY
ncbi:MAG: YraN family protein [Lachnospiraceae bacterium]|nr:YraN family protein [Lachnospiraceae bacterium]